MKKVRIFLSLTLAASLAVACDKTDKPTTPTPPAPSDSAPVASVAPSATTPEPVASTAPATPPPPKGPVLAHTYKEGFATPESVLYDEGADAYLVSNINGTVTAVDNNGFISRLSPDGKVENLKWIEGGKNKVTLNAPKGLAIAGDLLYVADIDTVRLFDKATGAPKGDIKIPGATFLNDVAATADGHVLVTDSGLKIGKAGFDPTGSDAVYSIGKDKKVTTVIKNKDLGRPNGVWVSGDNKTWISTFGTGEIYTVDAKGVKSEAQKLPKGQLDGIAFTGTEVLVSSWESSAIYKGKPGGEWQVAIENVKSPADIAFDGKRHRVLVPLFLENEIRAYDMH